jgi:hypothetical protein
MRTSFVWALVLLAGLGILHAVSPGRSVAAGQCAPIVDSTVPPPVGPPAHASRHRPSASATQWRGGE